MHGFKCVLLQAGLSNNNNLFYREETVPTFSQEYNKHSQKEKEKNQEINIIKYDQNEFDVSKLHLAVNNFFTRTLYHLMMTGFDLWL